MSTLKWNNSGSSTLSIKTLSNLRMRTKLKTFKNKSRFLFLLWIKSDVLILSIWCIKYLMFRITELKYVVQISRISKLSQLIPQRVCIVGDIHAYHWKGTGVLISTTSWISPPYTLYNQSSGLYPVGLKSCNVNQWNSRIDSCR